MSLKWGTGSSDSGILRRNDVPEKIEDLLVFGYSCKLFRDDEKALSIDQGKHLIPWMGDETLKIDRYDGRGALVARDLAAAEAGTHCTIGWQNLTSEELRAERLCDEERYRALHCDEDEEEMYREEELKRLHMARGASYGQVGFNYDGDNNPVKSAAEETENSAEKDEEDEPFIPVRIEVPDGMPLPQTKKLNAIIEKTAFFISGQGTQMEILLKAKQAGNPQFDFLSLECPLHAYYSLVLSAIREGRFRSEEEPSKEEEKQEEDDHYLHPSLAPVSVESAPSIPSIAYKPSANCAYSMLVSQIKGTKPQSVEDEDSTPPIETDLEPPGTETQPLPVPSKYKPNLAAFFEAKQTDYYNSVPAHAEIAKGPVLYVQKSHEIKEVDAPLEAEVPAVDVAVPDLYDGEMRADIAERDTQTPVAGWDSNTNSPRPEKLRSTKGLLSHYYNSDSEEDSDSSTGSNSTTLSTQSRPLALPPADQQMIIDKMASYVAKNGDDFERIVKIKGDPRFSFLESVHQFHPYYRHKRAFYERANRPNASRRDSDDAPKILTHETAKPKAEMKPKIIAPVSFSIKKIKEPEPILPKPALPYESSSDEETSADVAAENTKNSTATESVAQNEIKPVKIAEIKIPQNKSEAVIQAPKIEKVVTNLIHNNHEIYQITKEMSSVHSIAKESPNANNQTYTKRKTPEKRDSTLRNSDDSDEHRHHRKRRRSRNEKKHEEELTSDVITIEDFDPAGYGDYIDLTEDIEDEKYTSGRRDKHGSVHSEKNRIQTERKKRAAAFLSSLKDTATAPVKQHYTLASAMVKTLNTLQSKKEAEEDKYRRRDRHGSGRKSKRNKRDRKETRDNSQSSGSQGSGAENARGVDGSRERSSHRSRKHHSSSRSKYSKKSKRKHSRDKRSPTSSKSKTHKDDSRKTNLGNTTQPSSKERRLAEEKIKLDKIEEDYKTSRKQDKLLTSSLKDLVRETKKDLITCTPIKMALDIFSNDSCSDKSAPSERSARSPQVDEDSEKLSGGEDDEKKSGSGDESSASTEASSESE